jgi:hypothetical protein
MADIIDMTKLREAKEAADATAILHEVLCIAADETADGRVLSAHGRAALIVGVLRALGPGWALRHSGPDRD